MSILPVYCTMKPRQPLPYTASGDSPLCIAIREGYLDSALHLAKHAFGLNVPDKNGDSPLHLAVKEKNQELVGTLLASGASPNVTDRMDMTPLHVAILQKSPEIVSVLLANGANPDCDRPSVTSPLRLAISGQCEEITELLLKAGANPDKRDVFGHTDFVRAVALNTKPGGIPSLMVQHSKDLDQRCSRGVSKLSMAIHQNNCTIAYTILERMSSLNIKYHPDYHPILIAIKNNCWTCFDNLITFRGVEQLHASGENLPSALEVALAYMSWNMDIIDGRSKKVFYKNHTMSHDSRFGFALTLISKYGVAVDNPFFQSILSDCVQYRNGIQNSKRVVSLCISAYGGFWGLDDNDNAKRRKISTLFDTLGKSQTYDLMYKMYEAGFCYNTGNVIAIHHHHERSNLPLDIINDLNQLMKEIRSLKNLAVLRVRSCLHSNVIHRSQLLGVPKAIQNIIIIGTWPSEIINNILVDVEAIPTPHV